MIDPNEIDFATLPSVPLSERGRLPASAAIYLAVDATKKVYYVGRTRNLRKRWGHHHCHIELEQIGGINIHWIESTDEEHLHELESALILRFLPPLNKALVEMLYTKDRQIALLNYLKSSQKLESSDSLANFLNERLTPLEEKISRETVRRWLSGKQIINHQGLVKLAHAIYSSANRLGKYLAGDITENDFFSSLGSRRNSELENYQGTVEELLKVAKSLPPHLLAQAIASLSKYLAEQANTVYYQFPISTHKK